MSRERIREVVGEIADACGALTSVAIMEVCGTHTVSLFRSGVKSLLPEAVRLISGPGCPVCVTSQGYLDTACELAGRSEVTICTYGDMVRVPGQAGSLESCRGAGADVVLVYSARDAVRHAAQHPDKKVVFLAVGFETTAPATAAAVLEAEAQGLTNFFILPGHKLVIPAMEALLSGGEVAVEAFMCPGHVSIIIGAEAYEPIATKYGKPCVITGFEPLQLVTGILHLVRQVAAGDARVENVYGQVVPTAGNPAALALLEKVFQPGPAVWRAMGTIDGSGLDLRDTYKRFDALEAFGVQFSPDVEPAGCRCGEVIQGKANPRDCALFGKACTPMKPVGPCMVSSEGTCSAWFKYG